MFFYRLVKFVGAQRLETGQRVQCLQRRVDLARFTAAIGAFGIAHGGRGPRRQTELGLVDDLTHQERRHAACDQTESEWKPETFTNHSGGQELFTLLPFGKRYRTITTKSERHRRSFYPSAVRQLNGADTLTKC